MKLSIRSRLSISFALLFTALIVLFSGVIFHLMSKSLDRELLRATLHDGNEVLHVLNEGTFESQLEEMDEESREFNIHIKILNSEGKIIYLTQGVQEWDWPTDKSVFQKAAEGPIWSNEEINEQPHLTLSRFFTPHNRQPYLLQIAKPEANMNRIRDQLIFCINLGTPIILVIAILMGHFFSRKALAPVEQIRLRAQTINSDNLQDRLTYHGPPDELYRLTQTLNDMLGRIEHSVNQTKRFIADASHELRIPLTGLRGTVEVALRKKRSIEEHEQVLEIVHKESERLSELVWDLLSLARADAGELKLEKREVDIETFLKNVFEEAEALNAEKQIQLLLSSVPAGRIYFDEAKIHQLMINLIENAIRYNKPGGTVILSGRLSDSSLILSVKDTGMGISSEDQIKIFDRFYRVDKARSREAGGTGLGLSIARSIAEVHGGSLAVQSVLGEGSEFILNLPLTQNLC